MTHYSTPACRHENGPKKRPKIDLFFSQSVFWAGGLAGPSQFGLETGAM